MNEKEIAMDIEKKLQKIFKENEISHDFDIFEKLGTIAVQVNWGDWKHDHGYLDAVMAQNGFKLLGKRTTEEDGSDCYSAIHVYKYK